MTDDRWHHAGRRPYPSGHRCRPEVSGPSAVIPQHIDCLSLLPSLTQLTHTLFPTGFLWFPWVIALAPPPAPTDPPEGPAQTQVNVGQVATGRRRRRHGAQVAARRRPEERAHRARRPRRAHGPPHLRPHPRHHGRPGRRPPQRRTRVRDRLPQPATRAPAAGGTLAERWASGWAAPRARGWGGMTVARWAVAGPSAASEGAGATRGRSGDCVALLGPSCPISSPRETRGLGCERWGCPSRLRGRRRVRAECPSVWGGEGKGSLSVTRHSRCHSRRH